MCLRCPDDYRLSLRPCGPPHSGCEGSIPTATNTREHVIAKIFRTGQRAEGKGTNYDNWSHSASGPHFSNRTNWPPHPLAFTSPTEPTDHLGPWSSFLHHNQLVAFGLCSTLHQQEPTLPVRYQPEQLTGHISRNGKLAYCRRTLALAKRAQPSSTTRRSNLLIR